MYPGLHAATTPEKPAVVMADDGRTVTYAELEERSVRLAHVLHDHGLEHGEAVALLAENAPVYHEAFWATKRSGLLLTALNHHLSLEELVYIVRDCGARALLVSAATPQLAEVGRRLAQEAPGVTLRLAADGVTEGFDDYEAALAAASPVPFEDQPAGGDMLYSSGTTGHPKAIRPTLPERQVDEPGDLMVDVFGRLYDFGPDAVYLSPAPLYHAAPLRFGGIVQALGGTVVVMPRFDAERALQLIGEHRVTHSQWVPTMFVRMLKLPEPLRAAADVSSLRYAIHAAAPCPVEVKQAMIDWWGPILHEYYAATEAAGVTIIGPEDWLTHPGSVGRAALGVVHVCDETTAE